MTFDVYVRGHAEPTSVEASVIDVVGEHLSFQALAGVARRTVATFSIPDVERIERPLT